MPAAKTIEESLTVTKKTLLNEADGQDFSSIASSLGHSDSWLLRAITKAFLNGHPVTDIPSLLAAVAAM